jgi:Flp pilus assembly protein TadD
MGVKNDDAVDAEFETPTGRQPVKAEAPPEEAEAPLDAGPVTVGDLVEGARSTVSQLSTSARRMVDRGRYRKVRISRGGKPVLPDIPVAAVAAAEAASLYGAGFARVLAAHVGARFLFDIEIVNEADRFYKHGVERFLEGDWERAEDALLKAVHIDDCHAPAYLQLGVLYRLIHRPEQAREVLVRARALDETGEVGRKAGDILRAIDQE